MVHFSSRSPTDYTYTDVIDVNVHPTGVPEELKYGSTTGDFGWVKVDHCQFIEPVNLLSPVRDATNTAAACRDDMERFGDPAGEHYYSKPLGINVVPATNPDVVPGTIIRDVESVSTTCTGDCISVNQVPTEGFCRAPTAIEGESTCTAPAWLWSVTWANPLVSRTPYGPDTVNGAKAGDFIEWTWDDVLHDVWLMASPEAAAACNFTDATELIPPSHHATIDPTTNLLVPGRNSWQVPPEVVGQTLNFACSVSTHCADGGQMVEVEVGATPAQPDPSSDEGICPEGFELCPDNSEQTGTTAEFETKVNVPWTDARTAASLRLGGPVTRAATPWGAWEHRRFEGQVCADREFRNTWWSGAVDYKKQVWDLLNRTLREALDACSSNHPEICMGVAWNIVPHTVVNVPEISRSYSRTNADQVAYGDSMLDAGGWVAHHAEQISERPWMQMDLGSVQQVTGVVTQDRSCCNQFVTLFTAQHSVDGENFTVVPEMLRGPRGPLFEMPCAPEPDANNLAYQEPCSNPGVEQLHITTRGAVGESPGHSDAVGMYVAWIPIVQNVTVSSGCTGCLLEFSNGNGGSFRSIGVHHWAWNGDTMFVYLPDGTTAADVNAVISMGDTLIVTDLTADGVGPTAAHDQVEAEFPAVVSARYIRLRPLSWVGFVAMRAAVMVPKESTDMYTGRHHFRRCLVSDGYTRLISVGASTVSSKAVACPGCYECREMPNPPATAPTYLNYWGEYTRHLRRGFDLTLSDPRTGDAVLTAKLPEPVKVAGEFRLTWPTHELEVLCRIDPAFAAAPAAPDLDPNPDWTTFLMPNATGSPLEALAAGFAPVAAATAFRDTSMADLAIVYPPGAQIDPGNTTGPYPDQDWFDLRGPSDRFQPGAPQSHGGDDAVWWPPKPAFKVTFQPRGPACTNYAHPSCALTHPDIIEGWQNESGADGWHVDHGDVYGARTNSVNGDAAEFGWRCTPQLQWYGHGHLNIEGYDLPGFAWGVVQQVGEHRTANGVSFPVCPDGKPNAWEISVPNGLYMVTVGHANNFAQPTWDGCTYENVRTTSRGQHWMNMPQTLSDVGGVVQITEVHTAEVLDGQFTLSNAIGHCGNINWIKLDLLTSTPYPAPWLPSPANEWWQMELADPATPIGLVQIMLPHERSKSFESFPAQEERHAPDCRGWWLYAPAKCYHMMVLGQKRGVHPDLGAYPEFPGFTTHFLEWLFDQHDTNGDDSITFEEFVANTNPPYGWDQVTRHGNLYTYPLTDNLARLFKKIDVEAEVHGRHVNDHGDGVVSRAEFVNGILTRPRTDFCDTHEDAMYPHPQFCTKHHNVIPQLWSNFTDDGEHGFVVMVSDVPCTDAEGCLPVDHTNVTVCGGIQLGVQYEHQVDNPRGAMNSHAMPPTVDCGGVTGRYLQVWLPGQGRLFSADEVRVHRARLPGPEGVPLRTDAGKQMTCYGLEARQPPEATDPDVLAEAKNHPYQTVTSNPEDPIFYSTCYVRAIIKEWLPVEGDGADAGASAAWSFANGTHCLDCNSYVTNAGPENGADYNMSAMATPRWWLQPADACCTDCDTGLPPEACGDDEGPEPPPGATTHTVSWGLANVAASSITITTGDTVRWVLDQEGGHNVVSGAPRGSPDGGFSSPWMASLNDEWNYTFTENGSFPYYCDPHATMVAIITVVDPDPNELPPEVAFLDNLLGDPSFEGPGVSPTHLVATPSAGWAATGTTGFVLTNDPFEVRSGVSAAKVSNAQAGESGGAVQTVQFAESGGEWPTEVRVRGCGRALGVSTHCETSGCDGFAIAAEATVVGGGTVVATAQFNPSAAAGYHCREATVASSDGIQQVTIGTRLGVPGVAVFDDFDAVVTAPSCFGELSYCRGVRKRWGP